MVGDFGRAGPSRAEATYVASYSLLFALVIAGYPIVASLVSLLGIESRVATVPYRVVVIAFGVLVAYLASIYNWGRWYRGAGWVFFGAFVALYVLRLIIDTVVSPIPLRLPPEEYWLQFFAVCMIPSIPFLVAPSGRVQRAGFHAVLYTAIIAGAMSVFVGIGRDPVDSAVLEGGRIGSDVFSPIYLGHLGVTLMLMAVTQLIRQSLRGRYWVWTSGVATMLGASLLAMSGSRGPVLALVVSLTAVGFAYRREYGGRIALASLLVMALTFGLLIYAEKEFGFNSLTRLEMTLDQAADESILERREIMSNAWDQFLESPLIGSAVEERVYAFYPHNVFVEAYMATGVLGGAAFAALLLMTGWAAYRAFRTDAIWIALIYFQQLIFGQSSGGLYFANVMWATMASVLAVGILGPRVGRDNFEAV